MNNNDRIDIPNFVNTNHKTNSQRNTSSYDDLRRKSTSGGSAQRNRQRKEKLARKKKIRRIKYMLVAAGTTVAILLGGAGVKDIQDKIVVEGAANEFYLEVIKDNIHPASAPGKYWIDYYTVAKEMEDYADDNKMDFCEAVYFCSKSMPSYDHDNQLSCVLKFCDYEDLNHFYKDNGFKDKDDFNEQMYKEVLLSSDVNDKKNQLEQMKKEREKNTTTEDSNKNINHGGI